AVAAVVVQVDAGAAGDQRHGQRDEPDAGDHHAGAPPRDASRGLEPRALRDALVGGGLVGRLLDRLRRRRSGGGGRGRRGGARRGEPGARGRSPGGGSTPRRGARRRRGGPARAQNSPRKPPLVPANQGAKLGFGAPAAAGLGLPMTMSATPAPRAA